MEQLQFENSFRCSYINPPGIVRIEILDNAEIDVREAMTMHEFALGFSKGNKYGTLFIAGPMLNVTKEAREYGAHPDRHALLLGQAIVIQSLAQRILGNFIIRFNKGITDTKLFTSEAAAVKWLEKKLTGNKPIHDHSSR